ncbi:MAG TPA: hypothetical protein VFE37_29175 [Chloroflexota bacterium]|nr:hypothetical protein [Chloroflexota bacterium]
MLESVLTTSRFTQRRQTSGAHPEAMRGVSSTHAATAPTLDLLADGVAAFAAAPDASALGRALARRLARAASADCTTVWLHDPEGDSLALAAVWPTNGTAAARRLTLARAPWAEEAFERRAALRRPLPGELATLGRNGHEAPGWVVPLVAGTRRLGLAYVVARSAASHDEHVARVLTILGAQAALAARALDAPLAARRQYAEFLAVVAHDLKNVATSIKGYTQLLRRHLPAEIAPRAGRWTDIVERQVGVLAGTLSALVDVGRLHSGRAALDRQPVDLRLALEAVATRLPAADDVQPLRLELPDSAVVGAWDAARLDRALEAALDGLRRAVPAEAAPLTIALTAADGQARLRVGTPPPGEDWPSPDEWHSGAEASCYLLRGVVEAHGGTAGYRRGADGQPLLQVLLPQEPPAS